ncbi:hypothetical protein BGZ95_000726 [Linnemannia exigua]|uniref:Uncharacterized protein n=1 Tax=Linnemannia exigua TaxID=604196 RepID=A0AAD4D9L3_9FUNG|nr:hypothetical protein BGZ95_000726 [Linnemannia exigua]
MLYLFNNQNNGQKNQSGFLPEDSETDVDVKNLKKVKKLKVKKVKKVGNMKTVNHVVRPIPPRVPRFTYETTVPVNIKGIESTALVDPTSLKSRISSRVTERLGLCVTPHMILHHDPKPFYLCVRRTADDIPIYFCHLEEPKFARFDVKVDMRYYDLKLGRDLFGDNILS